MEQDKLPVNSPSVTEHVQLADADRRDALKALSGIGAKLFTVAMPMALTTLANNAKAQVASDNVVDGLRFALRLEYLMGAYYRRGLASSSLNMPAPDRAMLTRMAANVTGHADYLSKALVSKTITKPSDTRYDLSGGGLFNNVLSNYQIYLAVAQVLEDTAARAYKGLLLLLKGSQVYMTAGMSIHSVRARHAAAIRNLRGIKPWVSGNAGSFNDSGLPEADDFYRGEDNVKQAGSNVAGNATAAIEAFDEPLTMAEAEALLSRFNF